MWLLSSTLLLFTACTSARVLRPIYPEVGWGSPFSPQQ